MSFPLRGRHVLVDDSVQHIVFDEPFPLRWWRCELAIERLAVQWPRLRGTLLYFEDKEADAAQVGCNCDSGGAFDFAMFASLEPEMTAFLTKLLLPLIRLAASVRAAYGEELYKHDYQGRHDLV